MTHIVLALSTITTGLMAGMFFAWSFSVTNGLANVGNVHFIKTFQSMNRSIQNPAFLSVFLGSAILLPWSVYLHWHDFSSRTFLCLLVATVVYLLGSIGVTFLANIPLNNSLDDFNTDTASAQEIAHRRNAFEKRWNVLNVIRTASSFLAFVLLVIYWAYPSI